MSLVVLGGLLSLWFWRRSRQKTAGVQVSEEALRRGHQPESDTPVRRIAGAGAGLLLFLVMVMAAAALLSGGLQRHTAVPADVRWSGRPQLQVEPAADLMTVRLREDSLLQGVPGNGQISIDRAMELLAGRDGGAAGTRRTVRMLTESGYAEVGIDAPRPVAPAYLKSPPGPYARAPGLAERLGMIRSPENDSLSRSEQ